jgi:hypothetical protein
LPADRYPAIGEMVTALEAYLEESGLAADKVTSELARYFKAPASYEQALKERLVDHLTRRGQELLANAEQAPALDVFDRVLTIDPKNEKVLGILDGLNRRARFKQAGIAVVAASVIAFGGYMVHKRYQSQLQPPEAPPPHEPVTSPFPGPSTNVATVEPAPIEVIEDAAVVAVGPQQDAPKTNVGNPAQIDGGMVAVGKPLRVTVVPAKLSEVRFGDGPWTPVTEDGHLDRLIEADTRISVRNECCEETADTAKLGQAEIAFQLQALPANVITKCDAPGDVTVKVNGKVVKLGQTVPETFAKNTTQMSKTFEVSFAGEHVSSTPKSVTVRASTTETVTCDPQ